MATHSGLFSQKIHDREFFGENIRPKQREPGRPARLSPFYHLANHTRRITMALSNKPMAIMAASITAPQSNDLDSDPNPVFGNPGVCVTDETLNKIALEEAPPGAGLATSTA